MGKSRHTELAGPHGSHKFSCLPGIALSFAIVLHLVYTCLNTCCCNSSSAPAWVQAASHLVTYMTWTRVAVTHPPLLHECRPHRCCTPRNPWKLQCPSEFKRWYSIVWAPWGRVGERHCAMSCINKLARLGSSLFMSWPHAFKVGMGLWDAFLQSLNSQHNKCATLE